MKYLNYLAVALTSFFTISKARADITIPTNTGLPDPGNGGSPDPGNGIEAVLVNFTDWLLTIFLVLAVLSFVITGVMYILAMGDSRSESLERAKGNFKYSIIAVAVVGSAYIIITFIDMFLSASL